MDRHANKVAVVTGAGGGLGRAVALRLAAGGARVACSDVNLDNVNAVAEEIRATGAEAHAAHVDITDVDSLGAWRESVVRELGTPALLCNVAGILDRRFLADLPMDDFMKVVTTNLGGTYACTKAFLPDLLAADYGRIVNISSISGVRGYPYPSYGASKAGMLGLMNALLVDLWGTEVTINSVCPGAMDTPMLNHDALAQMVARTPAGKIAKPEDVAAVVDFLCGPEARVINGATIVVDGGATAVFRYFE